jgi:hypothetical protein
LPGDVLANKAPPNVRASEGESNLFGRFNMASVTKKRKASKPKYPDEDYHPGMAEWIEDSPLNEKSPRHVIIHENFGGTTGRELFRIIFDDRFSDESVRRIVLLITHAPELWRALRDATRELYFLEASGDGGSRTKFGEFWELLERSTRKVPFAPFEYHSDDDIYRLTNVAGFVEMTHEERLKLCGAETTAELEGIMQRLQGGKH